MVGSNGTRQSLAGGLPRPPSRLAATGVQRGQGGHSPSTISTSTQNPFHCDYGFNISLGADVFLNFNCMSLDVVAVAIGDGTKIGPAVQIVTADHPHNPAGPAPRLEFGHRIHIGSNVWIGGALILPG